MADLSKLKSKPRGLGTPPPPEEAAQNLTAPEHAPLSPPKAIQKTDGRTLRRTGRDVQFATRVTLEFHERIRAIAHRDGLVLAEVLERALDAYEQSR